MYRHYICHVRHIKHCICIHAVIYKKKHSSRSLCPKARDGHFLRQLRRRLQKTRGSDVGNLEARSSGEDWKQLQCPTYFNLIKD